jgi:hypothetical protein
MAAASIATRNRYDYISMKKHKTTSEKLSGH